jgi:two-component system, NarL family, sensor kinase
LSAILTDILRIPTTQLASELVESRADLLATREAERQRLRRDLHDGLGPALVGALQEYVDSVRIFSGPRLQLRADGVADLGQLPESVEVAAYRIATESLTNVLRHAHADSASIAFWVDNNQLQIKITDNGVVREPWTAGLGMSSMRDRATALGGSIAAGPSEIGDEVRVSLPLAAS